MRFSQLTFAALWLSTLPFIALAAEGGAVAPGTTVLSAVELKPTLLYQPTSAIKNSTFTYTDNNGKPTATYTTVPAAAAIAAMPVSVAYTIPLQDFDNNVWGYCWYPVSGYYGRLSRVLFYATMLFALFARRHVWLIVGALAASMTYSGVAAIQAMVIVWGNSGLGNNDVYAILGITLFASAMIIPLLTWSKTIQTLGQDREEDSIGRSIIIAWGLLIFTGFCSIFVGLLLGQYAYYSNVYSPATTSTDNFTCTPPGNALNLTAGQQASWPDLYPTAEFIEANGCSNPCMGLEYGTLLKPAQNLIPLNMAQVDHWIEFDASNKRTRKTTVFIYVAVAVGGASIIWSMLQTLTFLMYGRRTPTQARNTTYLRLYRLFSHHKGNDTNDGLENHRVSNIFAKGIAYALYGWGVLTAIISTIVVIGSIVATELVMSDLPQGDEDFEVDQWASWVATGLILITAFLYKFEGIFEDCFFRFINFTMKGVHRVLHGPCQPGTCKWTPSRETTKKGDNISIIEEAFENSKDHYLKRFTKWPGTWKASWEDSKKFYENPLDTASEEGACGHGHGRARKDVGAEAQRKPEEWKADAWLNIDEFVKLCRHVEQEHRDKTGQGYKWTPRVIEQDAKLDDLRTPFNKDLFTDIFRRHRRKVPGHDDEKTLHGQDTAYDPVPLHSDDEIVKTSPIVTTNPLDNGELSQLRTKKRASKHISKVHESSPPPIYRASTVPISQYSAAARSRHTSTNGPEAVPTPLQHASTFQERPKRVSSAQPRQASTSGPDDTPGSVKLASSFQERPKRVPVGRNSSSAALSPSIGAALSQDAPNSQLSQYASGSAKKAKPARVVSMDKNLPELPASALESWVNFGEEDEFLNPNPDYRDSRVPNVSPMSRSETGTSSRKS